MKIKTELTLKLKTMEIKIELTEQEVKDYKERFMERKLSEYTSQSYWESESMKNKLLEGIREKHQYGAELYLTQDFKKKLQETLHDQVEKLVEKQLKGQELIIQNIVEQFIFNHIEEMCNKVLKNVMVIDTRQQEEEEHHE